MHRSLLRVTQSALYGFDICGYTLLRNLLEQVMAERTPKRLADWEILETREVPAASLLADLNTIGGSSFDYYGRNGGIVIGGKAVFIASDGATQGVYVSDGSAKGTTRVASVTDNSKSFAYGLMASGPRGFFEVATTGVGTKLWSTDGTATGRCPTWPRGDPRIEVSV
jgi:hypothetical protein